MNERKNEEQKTHSLCVQINLCNENHITEKSFSLAFVKHVLNTSSKMHVAGLSIQQLI
jgi:hypothetical protein